VGDLALALASIFGVESEMVTIGTRHGEKLFETLLSREEVVKADDRGEYFRVPLDSRSLDYGIYFDHGDSHQAEIDDYTSHNTQRLSVDGVRRALLSLPEVERAVAGRLS
jgi:UDP-glucose 4-epimerase